MLCFPLLLTAQTKQKELEQRKKALLEQIKEMSALRQQQSQQHKTTVQQIEVANEKILARTRLIQINQQQANLLSKEIKANTPKLSNSRTKVNPLKTDCSSCSLPKVSHKPTSVWLI